jgi:hypothetical protein
MASSDDRAATASSDQVDEMATTTTEEDMAHLSITTSNLIIAEAADLQPGTTHSSIARILVKPGQIFRVQVDNEVKEVRGKFNVGGYACQSTSLVSMLPVR